MTWEVGHVLWVLVEIAQSFAFLNNCLHIVLNTFFHLLYALRAIFRKFKWSLFLVIFTNFTGAGVLRAPNTPMLDVELLVYVL